MRAIVVATIFLLSSFSSPSQAQQNEQSPPPQNQSEIPPAQSPPATVPVQPERTPQQAQQSRKEDRDRAEDVRIRPGWRAAEHDSDNSMGRMMARTGRMDRDDMARMMEMCERMMDRMERGVHEHDDRDRDYRQSDRADRSYRSDDEPSRRVKICIEGEDGHEYCRYRQ